MDWDTTARSERVDVVDPLTGATLDSRTISSFHGGTYLTWLLGGHVQLRFTSLSASNAVLSGLFFQSSSATFMGSDSTTKGTWKGTYGSEGYSIADDQTSLPSTATVTLSGQSLGVWASSTTDTRALQKATGSDRVAANWHNPTQFSIAVGFTDGRPRR